LCSCATCFSVRLYVSTAVKRIFLATWLHEGPSLAPHRSFLTLLPVSSIPTIICLLTTRFQFRLSLLLIHTQEFLSKPSVASQFVMASTSIPLQDTGNHPPSPGYSWRFWVRHASLTFHHLLTLDLRPSLFLCPLLHCCPHWTSP
jgi:hypothetical protein